MKTKLLRKIRKKYSIYRVDSYNTNPETVTEILFANEAKELELPFYELRRRGLSRFIVRQTKQEIIDEMMEMIRDRYKPIAKKEKYKSEKVWW